VKIILYISTLLTIFLCSCKEGGGHAKPDEDAVLLQLEPPTEETDIASAEEEDELPAIMVKPNIIPEIPAPKAIAEEIVEPEKAEDENPFPSLAANHIPASSLSSEDYQNAKKRFNDVKTRATEPIKKALAEKGLYLGDPIFIRIIKDEEIAELFIKERTTGKFKLANTYKIAAMSGTLGPKKAEGDAQAPEGFYFVPERLLNPTSNFHLSFDIGYPNSYDLAHGYTGTFIMMHGSNVSIGCYAMTNPVIEEIYTICHAALTSGKQKFFRFHSFPFRMTDENLAIHYDSPHLDFWVNLLEGYQYFEEHRLPPNIDVVNKTYIFSSP